ncbi:hypothetical protein BRADI_1g18305v3 [Brachypodium distachyon]|uniref:Uncharacterized protein n=1 Tax=Brachypodium distachyon TaxID=15368 RepID=A0A0Q3KUA9_BRADI|nr:hypothetical protein BRADI_1g18305v3 [Brachypodium distachyon]
MACGLQPSAAAAILPYSRRSATAAAAKGRPHRFNSMNQLHRRLPLFESRRFRNLVSSRCSGSSAEASISSRPADVSSAHNDLTTRHCIDAVPGAQIITISGYWTGPDIDDGYGHVQAILQRIA